MSLKDEDEITSNDTFCILPWIHLEVRENGYTYPCSRSLSEFPLGNFKSQSFKDIWNNSSFKNLRLNMLNNVKSSQCIDCYRIEKFNGTSLRNKFNLTNKDSFHLINNTHIDGSIDGFKLKFISIRLSNLCNLKCHYCDHNHSTAWIPDQKKLGYQGDDLQRFDTFQSKEDCIAFFKEHIDTLEALYIIGGEPLLDPLHDVILDYFIELSRTDISIIYNSNLTEITPRKIDLIEKWNKFDNIIIDASIDSHESRNDYIRFGSKWDKIEKNIFRIKNESNIKLRFYPTISIFNILTFIDSIKFWIEMDYIKGHEIVFNLLEGPKYFNIQILSKELKQKVRDEVVSFTKYLFQNFDTLSAVQLTKQFKELLQFMESSPSDENLFQEFKEQCMKIDSIRGSNWRSTFPELDGK